MNKVKIISDSTADLSKELYEKYNIEVLPLDVNFGEENYKDGVTITPEQLFAKVKEHGELPHTAAPSPAFLEETFKKFIDQGYDILYFGIGSGFSTAVQNAHIAAMNFPEERIFIVDSLNLSTGTGLLIMKAAKFLEEGCSAKEIYEKVTALIPNVVAQFTIEELEYLHKGGRCSGASQIFGHIFHIRPYIKVINGKMEVYKKPRGPMKVAIDEQLKDIQAAMPNVDMDTIFITSSNASDEIVKYTYDKLKEIVGETPIKITYAGCVVTSHCGKGCIGILYIKK